MRISSITLALVTLLAACGGGSSSVNNPQAAGALLIAASNYQAVAQESMSSAYYLLQSTSLVTGAQVASDRVLLSFGLAQLPKFNQWFAAAPRLVTGATTTQTILCSGGGSMSVSATDVNGNQQVDAGDSVSMNLANCFEGGLSMNGSMAASFTAITGNLDSNVYSAAMTMSFTNLSAGTSAGSATGNGSISIALSSTAVNNSTVTLTVASFATSGNYGGVSSTRSLQDLTISDTRTPSGLGFLSSTSIAGTLTSSALESRPFTLSTVAPLLRASSENYPSSGQLKAVGMNGSQVRFTAQSQTNVMIEVDADGNGVYEASVTKQWLDLL
jgi:hypothetical protein